MKSKEEFDLEIEKALWETFGVYANESLDYILGLDNIHDIKKEIVQLRLRAKVRLSSSKKNYDVGDLINNL